MDHRVEILGITPVTHNVRRYTIEKPQGYAWEPGQATEVSIDEYGWRERKNPFTFTALTEWPDLEFTIKSYFDHEGVTSRLWGLDPGDHLIIRDPWGTITYGGPGTFISGGAGVTPFIAILRRLNADNQLAGNRLIASHKTRNDLILHDEFEAMRQNGLELVWTVTGDDDAPGLLHGKVDEKFLKEHVDDFSGRFYLCGPDPMVASLRATLEALGAHTQSLTWEK